MHSFDQRTAQWLEHRAGKVTASRIADMLAKTQKGAWGAGRAKYKGQLIAERLSGTPSASYVNDAMRHGTETEPMARDAYAQHIMEPVEEISFVDHPTIPMSGASPDGLVGNDGLVEIKAPETHTHIATLLGKSVPGQYVYQIQWQMACTGRAWCDFASFDPRLPEPMQLFVIRLHRDDALIAELEREVTEFLAEVDQAVTELTKLYERQKEAA